MFTCLGMCLCAHVSVCAPIADKRVGVRRKIVRCVWVSVRVGGCGSVCGFLCVNNVDVAEAGYIGPGSGEWRGLTLLLTEGEHTA